MLLTEQEITELHKKYSEGYMFEHDLCFARAIEAKMIEKIKAQGPVAYLDVQWVKGEDPIEGNVFGTPSKDQRDIPLYALPSEGD